MSHPASWPELSDEYPLPAKIQLFISQYVAYRDLEVAERRAALNKGSRNQLWKNPRIRAEIQRRLDLIDKEIARLLVEIATSG
jgi:hypothetical protein